VGKRKMRNPRSIPQRLRRPNSRLDVTEDRVSELEDSSKELTQKATKTEIKNTGK